MQFFEASSGDLCSSRNFRSDRCRSRLPCCSLKTRLLISGGLLNIINGWGYVYIIQMVIFSKGIIFQKYNESRRRYNEESETGAIFLLLLFQNNEKSEREDLHRGGKKSPILVQ